MGVGGLGMIKPTEEGTLGNQSPRTKILSKNNLGTNWQGKSATRSMAFWHIFHNARYMYCSLCLTATLVKFSEMIGDKYV